VSFYNRNNRITPGFIHFGRRGVEIEMYSNLYTALRMSAGFGEKTSIAVLLHQVFGLLLSEFPRYSLYISTLFNSITAYIKSIEQIKRKKKERIIVNRNSK